MKGTYRSNNRLVMDLLTAIKEEGPVGVTRLLSAANLTHTKLQEMLNSFEGRGWVDVDRSSGRAQWRITSKGDRVLTDLRRVDSLMQDYGLGL